MSDATKNGVPPEIARLLDAYAIGLTLPGAERSAYDLTLLRAKVNGAIVAALKAAAPSRSSGEPRPDEEALGDMAEQVCQLVPGGWPGRERDRALFWVEVKRWLADNIRQPAGQRPSVADVERAVDIWQFPKTDEMTLREAMLSILRDYEAHRALPEDGEVSL